MCSLCTKWSLVRKDFNTGAISDFYEAKLCDNKSQKQYSLYCCYFCSLCALSILKLLWKDGTLLFVLTKCVLFSPFLIKVRLKKTF